MSSKMGQTPSIGRIVRYADNDRVFAAVITHVYDEQEGVVALDIFGHPSPVAGDHLVSGRTSVPFNAELQPMTWHWPQMGATK